MKIIAFVGHSGSGKTRLIARLVPELKKRGLTVAVVKHCSRGFDFGARHKDSSKFLAAGADGVALAAPGSTAVLRMRKQEVNLADFAREQFRTLDIVLVEGGKSDARLRKIEVLRKGCVHNIQTPPQELDAVVADFKVASGLPSFHPDKIKEIADWLVQCSNLKIRKDRSRNPS
jgi:molybdopterin-guanine dinucleotide biosynthesis protein B